MFANKEKLHSYTIKSNSIISQHLDEKHQLTCYQLQKLLLLIIKRYGLTNEDVKAKFNRSAPENVHVFLFNGLYSFKEPEVDEENVAPIGFLEKHGGAVAKKKKVFANWSNSMITLNSDDLPNLISDLEYLIDHVNTSITSPTY